MRKQGPATILSLTVISALIGLLGCTTASQPPTTTASATSQPSATASQPKTSAAPVSFAGKTITMVAPSSAGSGADTYARLYSKFLSKFLPGSPTMITRNLPGAKSTIAANFVYQSKPDGLTVLSSATDVVLSYAIGSGAAKYDLKKMPAVVATSGGVVFVIKPGIVDKVENLPKATGVIYGGGPGASQWLFLAIIDILDMHPNRVVFAYGGGGEARRSLFSNEINMLGGQTITEYKQFLVPEIEKGEVQPLFQSGIVDVKGELIRDPNVPELPTTREVYEKIDGKPPSGIAYDVYKTVIASAYSARNVVVLPPGTPDSIVAAYWDAAQKMVKDPDFVKMIGPMVGTASPWMYGKEFADSFRNSVTIDPQLITWIRAALAKYGYTLD
ncbi:MAG: hypothetical protein HYX90_08060 [Chloroflexi bacterium]|nr:hypothetical protein [Chloroflexota bacterium]